jgi:D-3-phosphoglycerate dehydrogenase
VTAYVTDFPTNKLVANPHVIAMPHLGASTPESEQNCAVMAAEELRDYLENGNIKNSVNLPDVYLDRSGAQRLCVLHKNIPAMLANITALLSRDGVNVENLSNKSKGDYAYTLVDLGARVEPAVLEDLKRLSNVIRVRVID